MSNAPSFSATHPSVGRVGMSVFSDRPTHRHYHHTSQWRSWRNGGNRHTATPPLLFYGGFIAFIVHLAGDIIANY